MQTLESAGDILGKVKLQEKTVEVPEWGLAVRLRELTAAERDRFEAGMVDAKKGGRANLENVRARLVAASAVDKDGKPIFTGAQVISLGEQSAKALDRLFDACRKLSGFDERDIEELAGN